MVNNRKSHKSWKELGDYYFGEIWVKFEKNMFVISHAYVTMNADYAIQN